MRLARKRQLDVFDDSDAAMARAYREAAATARVDLHFTEEQREARARYYLSEAERLETQDG